MGIFTISFGLLAGLLLSFFDISRWWRLLLFIVFLLGSATLLSAQQRTCVILALQKQQSIEGNLSDITSDFRKKAIKKRCGIILLGSFISAVILTLGILLLPTDL